jgi:hypothetical protein
MTPNDTISTSVAEDEDKDVYYNQTMSAPLPLDSTPAGGRGSALTFCRRFVVRSTMAHSGRPVRSSRHSTTRLRQWRSPHDPQA